MFASLLGAAIEALLNRALTLSPEMATALAPSHHQVLSITVRDLNLCIAFQHSGNKVHVLAPFSGHSDCSISADLETLLALKDPSQLTALIRQDKLDLDGNLSLAQCYSNAVAELDIDWAEQLAAYLGDGPAQLLVDSASKLGSRAKRDATVATATLHELLQDELQVAPHPLEFQTFKHQVRQVSKEVDSLTQRLDSLLQQNKGT